MNTLHSKALVCTAAFQMARQHSRQKDRTANGSTDLLKIVLNESDFGDPASLVETATEFGNRSPLLLLDDLLFKD